MTTLKGLLALTKTAMAAQEAMEKASRARASLPIGSSRAKVTTANARHASACEAYDRARDRLLEAIAKGLAYHSDY